MRLQKTNESLEESVGGVNAGYSVLMSVYAKEKGEYLRKAIDSMLRQTIPPSDFVIVCDGPLTQELDRVISEKKSRYPALFQVIRLKKNMGLGNALNTGIRSCKCELVARMDSDDVSLPDRCERQLRKFREITGLDIVSGTVQEFTRTEEHITSEKSLPQCQDEILAYSRRRCPFNHPCVMYRKTSVLMSGGYQNFYLMEDYDLWVRMLRSGAVGCNIREPLLKMRAGEQMYGRRGGLRYFLSTQKFRNYLFWSGYAGVRDFLSVTFAQFAVCCIPNQLRIWIYHKFLRLKEKNC